MTAAAFLHLMWPGNGFRASKKSSLSCFLFGKIPGMRKEILECRDVFKDLRKYLFASIMTNVFCKCCIVSWFKMIIMILVFLVALQGDPDVCF